MPQQEASYTLAESLVFKGHNYLPIPETCCEGIQRAICCILQQDFSGAHGKTLSM